MTSNLSGFTLPVRSKIVRTAFVTRMSLSQRRSQLSSTPTLWMMMRSVGLFSERIVDETSSGKDSWSIR